MPPTHVLAFVVPPTLGLCLVACFGQWEVSRFDAAAALKVPAHSCSSLLYLDLTLRTGPASLLGMRDGGGEQSQGAPILPAKATQTGDDKP